jgi:hypothetical protein
MQSVLHSVDTPNLQMNLQGELALHSGQRPLPTMSMPVLGSPLKLKRSAVSIKLCSTLSTHAFGMQVQQGL